MTCPQCGKEPEFRRDGEVAGFYCVCGLAFTRGDLGGLSDDKVREEMESMWMVNVEDLPLRHRLEEENRKLKGELRGVKKKFEAARGLLIDDTIREGEITRDMWSRRGTISASVSIKDHKDDAREHH